MQLGMMLYVASTRVLPVLIAVISRLIGAPTESIIRAIVELTGNG